MEDANGEKWFYFYATSQSQLDYWLDQGHSIVNYYPFYSDGRSTEGDFPSEYWITVQGSPLEYELQEGYESLGIFNNYLKNISSPIGDTSVYLLGKVSEFLRKTLTINSDGNEVVSPNGSDKNNGFWGFAWFPALGNILKPFFDAIRPFIQKVLSKLQQLAKQYWWLLPLVLILLIFFYKRKRKKK